VWGIEHAREPPRAGEPIDPEPVMLGTKLWLNCRSVGPAEPIVWVWRFPDAETYTLRFDGTLWVLGRGNAQPPM
jgi:hypothetical protein